MIKPNAGRGRRGSRLATFHPLSVSENKLQPPLRLDPFCLLHYPSLHQADWGNLGMSDFHLVFTDGSPLEPPKPCGGLGVFLQPSRRACLAPSHSLPSSLGTFLISWGSRRVSHSHRKSGVPKLLGSGCRAGGAAALSWGPPQAWSELSLPGTTTHAWLHLGCSIPAPSSACPPQLAHTQGFSF